MDLEEINSLAGDLTKIRKLAFKVLPKLIDLEKEVILLSKPNDKDTLETTHAKVTISIVNFQISMLKLSLQSMTAEIDYLLTKLPLLIKKQA